MNLKIFRAVCLNGIFLLLLGGALTLFLAHNLYVESVFSNLRTYTQSLASNYEKSRLAAFEGKVFAPFRVSVISPAGDVIYDSREDIGRMANHAQREEVSGASSSGAGKAERVSGTLGEKTFYYAVRCADGTVVRGAATAAGVLHFTKELALYMLLVSVLAVALSFVIAKRLSDRITGPINAIDLEHPLDNDIYDELAPLLKRLAREQEKIEAQMKDIRNKSEEMLVITGAMLEGLVLLNKDGEILNINQSACRILDTDTGCVGRNILRVDRAPYIREFLEKKEGQGRSAVYEFEKDGSIYKVYVNRIGSGEQTKGFAMLFIDVTASRTAERQRQEFTANVSHELKTPLQSVIGAAELLENNLVRPQDLGMFYTRIRREGEELLHLINDILFLSRLDEKEDQGLPEEEIRLKELCGRIFGILSEKAAEKHVSLSMEGQMAPFPGIERYFYELLFNLIDNAVKYNREGGSVKVLFSEDEKERVITVSDTGIGMSKADIAHIFERFYRSDKSRSKKIEGTGLGLSICKRIILFYKGAVRVKSAEGSGSVIRVTLPKA